MRLISLAGLMLLGSLGAAQADCVAHFHGQAGTRSDGLVTGVRVGEPCTISVYLGGSGRVSMSGIQVVRPPKHGALAVQGSALIYTPRQSFQGKDSFFVRFPMQNDTGAKRKGAGIRFAVRS
ncbi:hypothetical protein [Rhabdaerophilum sp.]|uniref:hypothetical protein n=1 Tax=Rhabdaerophilum sp. TaxID=2717341 RepID=UPI0038D3B2E8